MVFHDVVSQVPCKDIECLELAIAKSGAKAYLLHYLLSANRFLCLHIHCT
jgi:hypothetical protein